MRIGDFKVGVVGKADRNRRYLKRLREFASRLASRLGLKKEAK